MGLCSPDRTPNLSSVSYSAPWVTVISTEMIWERFGRSAGRRASGTEVLSLKTFSYFTNFIIFVANRRDKPVKWLEVWEQAVYWSVLHKSFVVGLVVQGSFINSLFSEPCVYINCWNSIWGFHKRPHMEAWSRFRKGNEFIIAIQSHHCLVHA